MGIVARTLARPQAHPEHPLPHQQLSKPRQRLAIFLAEDVVKLLLLLLI